MLNVLSSCRLERFRDRPASTFDLRRHPVLPVTISASMNEDPRVQQALGFNEARSVNGRSAAVAVAFRRRACQEQAAVTASAQELQMR